ncbi:hypothetical protein Tco_0191212 [Tanacetum coccineum]
MLCGLDQLTKRKEGGGMYLLWVPLIGDVRTLMIDQAHASRYLVHSGADKTYYDLKDMYSGHVWRRILLPMLAIVLTCLKVNVETSKTFGFIVTARDTRVKVGYNNYGLYYKIVVEDLLRGFGRHYRRHWEHDLNMRMTYHPQTDGQSKRTIQSWKDMLKAYHSGVLCALFEALYGTKYMSHVLWAEIGGIGSIGPELVQETTNKVILSKEKLKAARDCQKSYVGNMRKHLELKLVISDVGSVVLERCSKFWKERNEYWTDANMHVPLERIKVHKTLCFVEEPIKIIDREVKSLKPSRISIVKVCWNSKRGYEDFMKTKYPHILIEQVIVGSTN